MLLKRRSQVRYWERIWGFFWPRKSFSRSARYLTKRVLRLTAAPHAVAAGVAAGVFASFLPFLGFHFLIAACVAYLFRGNIVASALGTAVGNPVTFPFIWAGTLGLGRLMLYGQTPATLAPLRLGEILTHLDIAQLWAPLLKPMTVGGVPLGAQRPLARYGAIESALRERPAPSPHWPAFTPPHWPGF